MLSSTRPKPPRKSKPTTALFLTSLDVEAIRLQTALLCAGTGDHWVVATMGDRPAQYEIDGVVHFVVDFESGSDLMQMLAHPVWATLPPLTTIVTTLELEGVKHVLTALSSSLPSPPPPMRLVAASRGLQDSEPSMLESGMSGLSVIPLSLPQTQEDPEMEAAELCAIITK